MTLERRTTAFLYAYVALLHVIPIANMLGLGRLVPATALQVLLAAASAVLTLGYAAERLRDGGPRFTGMDLLVSGYVVLSLASFVLYFQPAHPVQPLAFAYGLHHLILPVPLFFAAKLATHDGRMGLLRFVCYLNLAMVLAGFALFVLRPAFYTAYLQAYYRESRNLIPVEFLYLRFASYMGSTAIGLLGAVTIILAALVRLPRTVTAMIPPAMLAAVLLSQQRGGMAATALALGYFAVSRQQKASVRLLALGVTSVVTIAGIVYAMRAFPGMLTYTLDRVVHLGEALGERAGSYAIGWRYANAHPLGLGLGATTSAAFNAGLFTYGEEVTDTNFLRILADIGIPGLALYLLILGAGVARALRVRGGIGWSALIATYALVAVGTNILDSFYLSHLLWIILATIDGHEDHGVGAARAVVVPELRTVYG